MTLKKSQAAMAMLTVGVLISAYFTFVGRHRPAAAISNPADAPQAAGTRPSLASVYAMRERQITGQPIIPGAVHPFPKIPKTRSGLPLDEDPFLAQSVEEQRWLDRNGFPNAQQWITYSTASDALLQQAASTGDTVASVMLAARQLSHGDQVASGQLMTAAANGSSFALSMLSAYMASSRSGNPQLAFALSRVVELRGDWRAAILRDEMFRTPLTAEQKLAANADALKIFNDLKAHSQLKPYVDPRPIPH